MEEKANSKGWGESRTPVEGTQSIGSQGITALSSKMAQVIVKTQVIRGQFNYSQLLWIYL
ncbi:hypothetical protein B9G39_28160 [Zooshikella ganghwensis]|uniref:Uncharacterized protein n=1 Tax=Zooshikella ganghwensis TaxID=202772 RepID=A0A4P9VEM1_9GAMM|nr:hypothetical protein B9G39_28160 [Zooshikella ganghwensis]